MRIQFITFAGCPHADAARETLRRCLMRSGLEPAFEEIDNTSLEAHEHFREWGSPTILLDGVDAGGEARPTGQGCRLYRHPAGRMDGSIPESLLLEAIGNAMRTGRVGADGPLFLRTASS